MKYLRIILGIIIHSFLVKHLFKANQAKTEEIINQVNDALIDLKDAVNRKECPKNENPGKLIDIVQKIGEFNKPQRGRGLEIFTPKQMLQRLLMAITQVKVGNTSESLLNEICQVIYSLYRTKEVTKKSIQH